MPSTLKLVILYDARRNVYSVCDHNLSLTEAEKQVKQWRGKSLIALVVNQRAPHETPDPEECLCQRRMKIPHFAGRKFLTPEVHERTSLASDGVEPSADLWRVLGGTQSEAKVVATAVRSCSRGGTSPALRRSFNR